MDRFYGGSVDLYGGKSKKEKDITTDIFKKDKSNSQNEKKTNSFILSKDLTRVLKKNRELYNYIEILENEKKELQDRIKQLEKNNK